MRQCGNLGQALNVPWAGCWWKISTCVQLMPCVPCTLQLLLNYKGQKLGVLEVESKWVPNKAYETKQAYGTSALEHPGADVYVPPVANQPT